MIYFTADQHFHHQNIIKYCNRPFAWYDQMDEVLIENFNKVVTDKDTVYHLGDFCFGNKVADYLSRLKGKEHHLILGNHDKPDNCHGFFHSVQDVAKVHLGGFRQPIWLSHYAHRVWPSSHHGALHLFGHSHGTLRIDPEWNCCDVGVDAWGFKPVSLDEILDYFKK